MTEESKQIIKALDNWVKNFDGKVTDFKTLCEALSLIKERDRGLQDALRRIKQYLHGILDEWYRRQEEPHFYGQNIMVYNHVRKELDDLYTFAEKLGVNLDKESQ